MGNGGNAPSSGVFLLEPKALEGTPQGDKTDVNTSKVEDVTANSFLTRKSTSGRGETRKDECNHTTADSQRKQTKKVSFYEPKLRTPAATSISRRDKRTAPKCGAPVLPPAPEGILCKRPTTTSEVTIRQSVDQHTPDLNNRCSSAVESSSSDTTGVDMIVKRGKPQKSAELNSDPPELTPTVGIRTNEHVAPDFVSNCSGFQHPINGGEDLGATPSVFMGSPASAWNNVPLNQPFMGGASGLRVQRLRLQRMKENKPPTVPGNSCTAVPTEN